MPLASRAELVSCHQAHARAAAYMTAIWPSPCATSSCGTRTCLTVSAASISPSWRPTAERSVILMTQLLGYRLGGLASTRTMRAVAATRSAPILASVCPHQVSTACCMLLFHLRGQRQQPGQCLSWHAPGGMTSHAILGQRQRHGHCISKHAHNAYNEYRCTMLHAVWRPGCQPSLCMLGAKWLAWCVQSIPNVSVPLLCLQVRFCAALQICYEVHHSQGSCPHE